MFQKILVAHDGSTGAQKAMAVAIGLAKRFGEEVDAAVARQTSLPEALHVIERQMILRALERHGEVQTRAAAELGISMLRYKLQKHGLRTWLGEEGATSDMAEQQASPTTVHPPSP